MYRTIQQTLLARIQAILAAKYDVTLAQLAVEQPPQIAMGEMALPIAFELAKRLRKAPRAIATELQQALTADLANLPGVASVEIAGAFDSTTVQATLVYADCRSPPPSVHLC